MMISRKNNKYETGSILIIVVAGMMVILGLLGLVVDVGHIFIQRARLVSAVDAVVLAGVQELPSLPDQAVNIAYRFGLENQVNSDQLSVSVSNANTEISAQGERDVELFFLRLFGFDTHQVYAEAAAEVGVVSACTGVAPFGIVIDDFQYNHVYVLKYDSHSDNRHHGNFGALRLGGNGADNYRNNIKYGYSGVLAVGDQVYTEPGNMAGPTDHGVSYRINQDYHSSFDNFDDDSPRIVIVPIVDNMDIHGTDYVTILGFAAFYLEHVERQGNVAIVKGRFIEYATDAEIGNAANYGLKAYRLLR